MDYSQKDIERFWSKVDKEKSATFYNGTRCWEWTAGCFHNGYGHAYKDLRAHRVAYELTFGEIPVGLSICHHCDNPPCCNPDHLFSGTEQDNKDDMVDKERSAIGEKNPNHKLTNKQIVEVRQRYGFWGKGGETSTKLSKEFGVSQTSISDIVNGVSWKCLSGGEKQTRRLSDEEISEIRRRYSFFGIGGDDSVTLAKEFGVNSKTIRNIAKHKTHK